MLKKCIEALIGVIFLCLVNCGASYGMCSRSSDSLILVKFNQATNGDNWFTKWNFSTPISSWHGVFINTSGCVTQINLNNNNLTGFIPNEIGGLGSLSKLFLFSNSLEGSLPATIGSLSELVELNLEGNKISGVIPNTIASLTKLTFISLASNQLQSSIPPGIFSLSELIQLRLNSNQLSGTITDDIQFLTKVQVLDLSENQLQGTIPSGISALSQIQDLSLNDNLFSGQLPASMSGLTKMINLWLQNNRFTGIVPNLTAAPLLSLRVENNFFTGIPDYSVVRTLGRTDPFGLIMHNNYFTFEDLLPLLSLPRAVNWVFKPQRPVQVDSLQFVQYGSNYAIRIFTDPGVPDNNYKWFKDTAVLTITNQNFFQILNMDEKQEGYYYGSIVNQSFPEFSISVPFIRIVGYDFAKCDTPLAGETCDDAPYFCNTKDIDSYCGNMNISNGFVRSALCNPIDNLDNPRFIQFVASSDSLVLEIFPLSCSTVKVGEVDYTGLQAAIVKGCDTTSNSTIYCQNECQSNSFLLGGPGFIKGEVYTLVLDGCQGSVCNYLVKVRSDRNYFQFVPENALQGLQVFCPDTNDHFFTLRTVPGAKEYKWSLNDTIVKVSADTFYNVKNNRSGVFKISVQAFANCDTTNIVSKTFRIFPRMLVNNFVSEKNNNDSIYTVRFKITGGSPPYFLSTGAGKFDTLNGDFVSDSKLCRSNYYFEIKDRFNCSIIISGREKCSCDSEAGSMPTDTMTICGQDNIVARNNNDGIRDTGDVSVFILCSDTTKPFNSILRLSQSGIIPFDITKFKYDSVYYLVYAVGRGNGLNQISFTHPCLSITNFQPVVYRRKTLVTAGADRSICSNVTRLVAAGNFVKVRWFKISGPEGVVIDYTDSAETEVRFDSIGTYIFRLEASNNFCITQDDIKIQYDTIYKPIISGVTKLCNNKETVLDVGDQLNYKWSTGDTTRSIIVKTSGRYCVEVTNSPNCAGDTCVDVTISSVPVFEITGNIKICNGASSILQPDKDFAQYNWSSGATSKSINIDMAGKYCLTVTNSEGCTSSSCVDVTNNQNTSSTRIDSSCNKSLFVFNGKLYDVPGNYQVILKNANSQGCDSIITLNLYAYPIVTIRDSFVLPDLGNNSGGITLTTQGGVRPLRFKWSNGATTQSIQNLKFGTYTVTITDVKNCSVEFTFNVKNSVGINEIDNDNEPEIFPIPAFSGQNIVWKTKQQSVDWFVEIFDADGKKLNSTIRINTNKEEHKVGISLLPGVYTILSRNNMGKKYYKRIIVFNN
ncbi:MAG: T9SS type A sorting domain-containing protein [Saprospiraceae bacterium]|nr:T9SS type A sorting domain-containing protein [Saprospiraceae bacterium]